MSAPIALIDANVLYDVVLRDLLMQLALSRLFRARWTAKINDEWTRSLLANRPDISAAQIDYTKAMMARAVPDGLVEGYEKLIVTLELPDPGDRHVLAAAIAAQADVIVTLNLKDFPREALQPHGIDPWSPDQFLAILSDVAPEGVIAAARECRARLANPPLSADDYLTVLGRHGLTATAEFLRANSGGI
jgi:hypothetical protein